MAKITVLLVMARESRLSLFEQLEACGVEVLPMSTYQEARRVLQSSRAFDVVLVDAALADGSWRQVLDDARQSCAQAEVVVCARHAERNLWREIVAHGASDLLVESCSPDQMRDVLEAAAARGYMRSLRWEKAMDVMDNATTVVKNKVA